MNEELSCYDFIAIGDFSNVFWCAATSEAKSLELIFVDKKKLVLFSWRQSIAHAAGFTADRGVNEMMVLLGVLST